MTRKIMKSLAAAMLLAACAGCAQNSGNGVELLPEEAFAKTVDGKETALYTIRNGNGMTVQLTNYGARIVDLWVPSNDGSFKDVVWGYDSIDAYLGAQDKYSGPVVGRYGNRIKDGKFSLDGKE